MKSSELRNLSLDELLQKLEETKEEHFRLRCNHTIQQLQDTRMIKKRRRDIARINTEINARKKE